MKNNTKGATRLCHSSTTGSVSGACKMRAPDAGSAHSCCTAGGSGGAGPTFARSASNALRSVMKPAGQASRSRACAGGDA